MLVRYEVKIKLDVGKRRSEDKARDVGKKRSEIKAGDVEW